MSLHIMALLQLSTLALQFAPEKLRQTGLLYFLRHCLPKCLEKKLSGTNCSAPTVIDVLSTVD